MKRLKETSIDDPELRDAKEHLKGSIYLAAESTDNQMTRLAHNEINFGREISLEELAGNIDAVTAEDVMTLAGEMFRDKAVALALLGPIDGNVSYQNFLNL